jgi:DMSO/TMAO reductase YedYZ molybdopterin-dependent catalytic subunit
MQGIFVFDSDMKQMDRYNFKVHMDILKLDLLKTEADIPTERETRFQVALLSSLAGVAASLIARFVFDMPLLPELFVQAFFTILPINLIALVVGFLGPFAKHLAFLAFVVLYAALLTAAAYLFLGFYAKAFQNPKSSAVPGSQPEAIQNTENEIIQNSKSKIQNLKLLLFFLIVLWLFTMLFILPLFDGGVFGQYLRQGALFSSLSLLVVLAIYVAAIGFIANLYLKKPEVAQTHNHRFSRRQVVRGIWGAILAVGVYDIARSLWGTWFQANSGRVSNGNGSFPNINELALEITPTKDFYLVSKNPFDPEVDVQRWRLEIGGLVENPLSLNYEEMKSLPFVEQYATLECIDNPVGGNLIGNALWRGVRLKDLLQGAGIKEGVVDLKFSASDGYTDSIALERAINEATILVYEMNGEPLTSPHGFPVRLLIPGIFGMKNVKWITKIEAVNYDFKGYWQRRGWDDKAEYKTMSRIDAPDSSIKGSTTIAGIAFAGDREISKVEVSTDGGKTWEQAEIKPALSKYSWVLWHKQWSPAQAGKYLLKVRATDGRGDTQVNQNAPPDPSGATGLHSVNVTNQ